MFLFINLYMFRATMCPSSGDTTVFMRHLVLVYCVWMTVWYAEWDVPSPCVPDSWFSFDKNVITFRGFCQAGDMTTLFSYIRNTPSYRKTQHDFCTHTVTIIINFFLLCSNFVVKRSVQKVRSECK